MLPMPKPALDAETVYTTCTATARPKSIRPHLQQLTADLNDAAARYDTAAAGQGLHTLGDLQHQPDGKPDKQPGIKKPKPKAGGLNTHLEAAYTNRLVPEKSPGHGFYRQLMEEAPDGRCPLCSQGVADTLDHQLPKAVYPLLAVVPVNLVPACRDCNFHKGDQAPATAKDQTLHPYYDHNVHDYTWLVARIIEPPKPSITFHVEPPPDMPPTLAARVRLHFTTLRIARLYNPQAGPAVRTLSLNLRRWKLPSSQVPQHLLELAEDAAAENPNSWQTALYTALASNAWYTQGGYEKPWR